jgi:hypothetical protein
MVFDCFMKSLNGLKKFATLLQNNWLAETPQALALMRLGRQPAQLERFINKKTEDKVAFFEFVFSLKRCSVFLFFLIFLCGFNLKVQHDHA